MDPLSLLVDALALGVSTTVSVAVQDAYRGLRDTLVRRWRRPGDTGTAEQAVQALEMHVAESADPQIVRAAVARLGAAEDAEVLAAARRVLEAADPDGARVGKYVIDLREAKGVQVGDNPTMTINF